MIDRNRKGSEAERRNEGHFGSLHTHGWRWNGSLAVDKGIALGMG